MSATFPCDARSAALCRLPLGCPIHDRDTAVTDSSPDLVTQAGAAREAGRAADARQGEQ